MASSFAHSITIAAAICIAAGSAQADTVTLKDGRVLTGTIETESPRQVSIRTGEGVISLQRQQVARLHVDPAGPDIEPARQNIAQGRISAALNLLRLNNQTAHLEPILTQAVVTNPDLLIDAAPIDADSLLDHFSRVAPKLPTRLLMAAVAAETGQTSAASTLLAPIQGNHLTAGSLPLPVIMRLLDRTAAAGFKANSPSVLSAASGLMEYLPASPQKRLASLRLKAGQITRHLKSGDPTSAALLFSPDCFEEMPETFDPLLAQTLEKFNVALPSTIDTAISRQIENAALSLPADRAALLLELASQSHALAGRYPEARAVADQISLINPDIGAIAQHRAEFLEKEAALPAGDALSRYQLASWARERQLLPEATRLLARLRKHPTLSANVSLQLQLVTVQQAKQTIARLRTLYEASRHEELAHGVDAFVKSGPPREFSVQALELKSLSEFEQWQSKKTEPERAESQFQQAERLANQGMYEEALSKVNQLELSLPGSPAAKQTARLRDQIMRQKAAAARKAASGAKPPG